jgi:hypothetical protein
MSGRNGEENGRSSARYRKRSERAPGPGLGKLDRHGEIALANLDDHAVGQHVVDVGVVADLRDPAVLDVDADDRVRPPRAVDLAELHDRLDAVDQRERQAPRPRQLAIVTCPTLRQDGKTGSEPLGASVGVAISTLVERACDGPAMDRAPRLRAIECRDYGLCTA